MSLRFKAFDHVSNGDFQALIRDEVTEQIYLEYKRELPGGERNQKIEFLKDVSSFANARGGYILYGMEEEDGIPKGLVPISKSIADKETVRLHQMIEAGIRPRIQGIRIRDVPHPSGICTLLVKIPQSFNRPHMITYQNHSRFYTRHSKGVTQMDVDQIRESTIASQSLVENIRTYRRKRDESIAFGDIPISITSGPYVVLHVIPLSSFGMGVNIDLSEIEKHKEILSALGKSPQSFRYNFNGFLGYHQSKYGKDHITDTYFQVYRNGRIEMVRTLWRWNQELPQSIPAIFVENWVLQAMDNLAILFNKTEIDWPISIGISLLHVKNCRITLMPWIGGHISPTTDTIDREHVHIPEVVSESSSDSIKSLLYPAFTTMWNSAAWPKSYSYKEDGTRNPEYSLTEDFDEERFSL